MLAAAAPHALVTVAELGKLRGDVTALLSDSQWGWHDPRSEKPAVLAFDVGAATGVVRLDVTGVQAWSLKAQGGPGDVTWSRRVEELVEYFAAHARRIAPATLVAIEDCFLARGPRMNPATMAGIAYYVGAVLSAAARHDLAAVRIKPTEWQSKILGKIHRAQGKALSRVRADHEFPGVVRNEHEADASLLALWVRGGR